MHLQMVDQGTSGAQHFRILSRGDLSERTRANIAWAFAGHVGLAFQPVSRDERIVDRDVPALHVFDKESHVWRRIEKLREQSDIDRRNRTPVIFR